MLAVIGVSLGIVFGRSGPSLSASSGFPSAPAGAPDQDEAATIVARFAEFHVGWVLVYADGRVISYPDLDAYQPPGVRPYTILERRLTTAGVDLVRSGHVEPGTFLQRRASLPAWADQRLPRAYWADFVPRAHWADPVPRAYEPSRYAVCPGNADGVYAMDRVPAAAQKLLRGNERAFTYAPVLLEGEVPPAECFELSAAEARALRQAYIYAGRPMDGIGFPGSVAMHLAPILPHGEPVAWSG